MTEKSHVPTSKTRLIFSVITIIVGFVVGWGIEPFDSQVTVGWVIVIVGVLSVFYNISEMRKGH